MKRSREVSTGFVFFAGVVELMTGGNITAEGAGVKGCVAGER